MSIADILKHKSSGSGSSITTIAPTEPVSALLATLAEHNIGAVVVLDGDRVVGIVSERDVVRRLAADGAAALDHPVADLMTTDVLSCSTDDDVAAIAATMTDQRVRHMPVIDDDVLVGIVSIGDVVSSQIRRLEHERGQLEQYISG
jgi:CBS domain-containing protein